MDDLLTVQEAARELGIEGSVVRRRLLAGPLRGERVHPRLWLIPRAEVERAKRAGRLKPGRKPRVAAANDGSSGFHPSSEAEEPEPIDRAVP